MPNARSRAYQGKHRRRAARRNTTRLAAISAAGTLLAAGPLVSSAEASATAGDFARLRMCESSNNYRINTGNGYYGAYQFDLQTWHGLGYGGRPDQAPARTQDEAARRLQADRGWAPWPACSRRLGLRGGASAASRTATRVHVVTSHAHLKYRPIAAPAYRGVALRTSLVGTARADVRAWQAQMARRGWTIAVDGRFGPRSAAVARAFQRELRGSGAGIVGPITWRLAWEAPVTAK